MPNMGFLPQEEVVLSVNVYMAPYTVVWFNANQWT